MHSAEYLHVRSGAMEEKQTKKNMNLKANEAGGGGRQETKAGKSKKKRIFKWKGKINDKSDMQSLIVLMTNCKFYLFMHIDTPL